MAAVLGRPQLSTSPCGSRGAGRGEGQGGGRWAGENPWVPRARCPVTPWLPSLWKCAAREITAITAPVTCQWFPQGLLCAGTVAVTLRTLLRPPHPPNAPEKRQPPPPFAHKDHGAPGLQPSPPVSCWGAQWLRQGPREGSSRREGRPHSDVGLGGSPGSSFIRWPCFCPIGRGTRGSGNERIWGSCHGGRATQ